MYIPVINVFVCSGGRFRDCGHLLLLICLLRFSIHSTDENEDNYTCDDHKDEEIHILGLVLKYTLRPQDQPSSLVSD